MRAWTGSDDEPIPARVELLAVKEGANIMDGDLVCVWGTFMSNVHK